jgi:outer membrane protein TolC
MYKHSAILAFISAALWLSSSAVAAQEGAALLTLREAVDSALVRGDRSLTQQDFVEQASLAVVAAANAFRPKLVPNLSGSFGQTDVSDQTYRLDVSQRFATGTEFRAGVGASTSQIPADAGLPDIRFYNADTTLMVSQPLMRGFGRSVARRALTTAEIRHADAMRQRTMAEQQIAVDVSAAYYRVVAQEAVLEVARQGFERARQLREASEAKMEAGLVSQLDVLRAQQLVLQAELQLFEAQSLIEDARDDLRFVTGLGQDATFRLETEIPRVTEPVTMEEAVRTALSERLDLQIATENAADADRVVAFARNQLLPQLDVNLALTRRQTAGSFARSFGLDGFQVATFFNISMPVDRTPQLVEHQNALIERDRRRREIDTLRQRIADDVRRGVRERERALRNLAAAETNVQIAQREVEVARLRYDRGLSNNLDVVTAETNLLNAESRRIFTLAELAVSRLSLRATMGILDPRGDIVSNLPKPVLIP